MLYDHWYSTAKHPHRSETPHKSKYLSLPSVQEFDMWPNSPASTRVADTEHNTAVPLYDSSAPVLCNFVHNILLLVLGCVRSNILTKELEARHCSADGVPDHETDVLRQAPCPPYRQKGDTPCYPSPAIKYTSFLQLSTETALLSSPPGGDGGNSFTI